MSSFPCRYIRIRFVHFDLVVVVMVVGVIVVVGLRMVVVVELVGFLVVACLEILLLNLRMSKVYMILPLTLTVKHLSQCPNTILINCPARIFKSNFDVTRGVGKC